MSSLQNISHIEFLVKMAHMIIDKQQIDLSIFLFLTHVVFVEFLVYPNKLVKKLQKHFLSTISNRELAFGSFSITFLNLFNKKNFFSIP